MFVRGDAKLRSVRCFSVMTRADFVCRSCGLPPMCGTNAARVCRQDRRSIWPSLLSLLFCPSFCFVVSCLILSYLVLSYCLFSYFVLSYLSGLVLSVVPCRVLSSLVLSCFVCFVLFCFGVVTCTATNAARPAVFFLCPSCRIDCLYVEQEVVADDTPAVIAVMKADKARQGLGIT